MRKTWPAAAVPLATAAGLGLLLWVSASGSVGWTQRATNPFTAPTFDPEALPPDLGSETVGGTRTLPTLGTDRPETPIDVRWLGDVLYVIVIILGIGLAVLAGLWLWNHRPERVEAKEEDEFDELPFQMAKVAAEEEDHLAAARSGSPRNGIVAAWMALEGTVARLGTPPLPHETSSETTVRLLGAWPIDPRPLTELASLYREARFSRHDMSESERERALSLLTELHAQLRLQAPPAELTEDPA